MLNALEWNVVLTNSIFAILDSEFVGHFHGIEKSPLG